MMKPMGRKLLTFVMLVLSAAVLLTVPALAAGQSFSDVKQDAWYYDSVDKVVNDLGLMDGYGDGLFGPMDKLTREQFVRVLASVAEVDVALYQDTDIHAVFSDVPNNAWYSPYVAWAYENGITSGTGDHTFGTGGKITRESVAKFIVSFAEQYDYRLTPSPDSVTYADSSKVSSWAVESVEKVRLTGLFQGDAQKNFNPTDNITRAEIATVLVRLMDILENSRDDLYFLQSITADPASGNVTVTGCAGRSAVLKVELLRDDQSAVLAQGTRQVFTACQVRSMTVPLEPSAFPEYYALRATLLDGNGDPLTDPLVSILATSAYAEFDAKTVADFAPELVFNMDEDPDDNFAVGAEGVCMFTDESSVSLVSRDESTGTYVLSGAGLSSLSPGDRVIAETEDAVLFIKIASISTSGSSVRIVEDPNASLDEFLQYLHVDVEVTAGAAGDSQSGQLTGTGAVIAGTDSQDAPNAAEGTRSLRLMGSDPEISRFEDIDIPLPAVKDSISVGPVSVDYGISGTCMLHLSLIYDAELFSKDSFWAEAWVDISYETESTFGVSADMSGPDALDIPFVELGTDKLLPEKVRKFANADFKAGLSLSFNVSGTINITNSGTLLAGFILDSTNGYQSLNCGSNTSTFGVKAEGEARIGPRALLVLKFDDFVDAHVEFFAGADGKAKLNIPVTAATSEESYHACEACLEGTVDAAITFTEDVTAKLFSFEYDKELSTDLARERLFQGYWSLRNDPRSVHGGRPAYGAGVCPNQVYRTTFRAYGSDGSEAPAAITAPAIDGSTVQIQSGGATYLYPGTYTATATIGDEEVKKDFTVTNSAQTVTLKSSGWIKAYADYLRTGYSGNTFALAYIDNDDIPELVMSEGYFHAAASVICTYKDGKVVELGYFGDYGYASFAPHTGMIWKSVSINGGYAYDTLYRLQNGEITKVKEFYSSFGGSSPRYEINGQSVSESTYKSQSKAEYGKYTWVQYSYSTGSKPTNANLNSMLQDYTRFLLK